MQTTNAQPKIIVSALGLMRYAEKLAPQMEIIRLGERKILTESITVIAGHDTFNNLDLSLRLALKIGGVCKLPCIYLNCILNIQAVGRRAKAIAGGEKGFEPLVSFIETTADDELVEQAIIAEIERTKAKALIVNSWDYAFPSTARRRNFVFRLRSLAFERGLAVIVFAQADPEKVQAGVISRGPLGLLMGTTENVIDMTCATPEAIELQSYRFGQLEAFKLPEMKEEKSRKSKVKKFEVNEINNLQLQNPALELAPTGT